MSNVTQTPQGSQQLLSQREKQANGELHIAKEKRLAGQTQVGAQLSGVQRDVLDLMFDGASVTDAARWSKVARSTVYHWFKTDANFQAAFGEWYDSTRRGTRSRLMALSEVAVGNVDQALRRGDTKVSTQFLKGIGFFPGKLGESPFDLRQTDREERIKHKEENLRLFQREMALFKTKAQLLDEIPRDGNLTAGAWAVVPIPLSPLTGLDLYKDLPKLGHPFIYAGKGDDPILFIQCANREDQEQIVSQLSGLGYDTICPYSPPPEAAVSIEQRTHQLGAPNTGGKGKSL